MGPRRRSREGADRRKDVPPLSMTPKTLRDAAARKPRAAETPPPAEASPPPAHPAAEDSEGPVKTFVVDTNVLLHNPNGLFVFKEHHVVIPFAVVEELDAMKRKDDDLGRNARETIRHLDRLRGRGRLTDGVPWGNFSPTVGAASSAGASGPAGTVRIDILDHDRPAVLDEDSPDNRIIATAWHLHQAGLRTIFVSKDISARIKSDALGITTQDFENQKVDADKLYIGFI